jgi:hypothetical protein
MEFQRDEPKLFLLILHHLSNESLEAIQKDAGWPAVKQDANTEASGSGHKVSSEDAVSNHKTWHC